MPSGPPGQGAPSFRLIPGRTRGKHPFVRSAIALVLAVVLVALAWAPHVHTGPHGDHDCPACLARNVEAPRSEVPDLAPPQALPAELVADPTVHLRAGAPQGAVPGQSPPVNG